DGDQAVKDRAKALREQRAKRSAAARKAADTKRRKQEDERREQEAKAKARGEERARELEVIEREMRELASRLIALDRNVAHDVYRAVTENSWDRRRQFKYALEAGLGLTEDEPDDTSGAADALRRRMEAWGGERVVLGDDDRRHEP